MKDTNKKVCITKSSTDKGVCTNLSTRKMGNKLGIGLFLGVLLLTQTSCSRDQDTDSQNLILPKDENVTQSKPTSMSTNECTAFTVAKNPIANGFCSTTLKLSVPPQAFLYPL